MRVTILPLAIILNNAHRAAVNIGQGEYCGLCTASYPSVFLIYTNQLYEIQ